MCQASTRQCMWLICFYLHYRSFCVLVYKYCSLTLFKSLLPLLKPTNIEMILFVNHSGQRIEYTCVSKLGDCEHLHQTYLKIPTQAAIPHHLWTVFAIVVPFYMWTNYETRNLLNDWK